MSKWEQYGKAIVAFLFVVWTVVAPLLFGDGRIDLNEGVIIAIAVGNNSLVYLVPLHPAMKSVKSVVNVVLVAVASFQTVMVNGWQPDDFSIIMGAIVAAVGVTVAPAASRTPNIEGYQENTEIVNGRRVVVVGTGADA